MDFLKKIKLFYIPFVVTAIVLWGGYTYLHWLLIIDLEVLALKDSLVSFWLPITLPCLPVLFILKPKLKFLKLTTKGGHSWMYFYLFMLWIILFLPFIIAQNYIQTATGKLTTLQNIAEVDSLPKTKYYTVKEFYIEKKNIGASSSFGVTGKHNKNFNMKIYIVVPMYRNYIDTIHVISWLGLTYSKTISNYLEQKEKDEAYKIFAEESHKELDEVNLTDFVYLSRVPNSDDSEGLNEGLKKSPIYTSNVNVKHLFVGVNESFEKRNGYKGIFLLVTSILGAVVWLLMILTTEFDKKVILAYESGNLNANVDVNEFIDYMKPKVGFFITPIIMYLNIGIFLAMVFAGLGFMSFESKDLITWGANYGPLTTHGERWRLIMAVFLHNGFGHIVTNMLGLIIVGRFLEPVLGDIKYVGVYLVAGIVASLTSLWWNNTVVSVGASGAIFGLYGMFSFFLIKGVWKKDLSRFMIYLLIYVGYNFVIGLFVKGIDAAAHIGGFVSGFLIGLVLYPLIKEKMDIDKKVEEGDSIIGN